VPSDVAGSINHLSGGRITDSLEIFSDRYLAIGLLCR
jgi:hypothetical protein